MCDRPDFSSLVSLPYMTPLSTISPVRLLSDLNSSLNDFRLFICHFKKAHNNFKGASRA